jgi:Lrp/AsnC family transcriptional regulator for asnA, asnC and gidA
LQNLTKIDETSAKILKTLLRESRTSFTEIAKDCKISVGAVRMRYKRLWKEGVIKGEVMLVNPHSLGYKCISDLGITTTVENEKEVMKFLTSKPYISQIAGPLGKYNIWAKVALHDTQDLSKILEDIETNPYIKHVNALIWVEAINIEYPENLVINSLTTINRQKHTSNEQNPAQRIPTNNAEETRIRIDETDRKIATILSQNSRTPFRNIAQQLNVSTKNVIQRYKTRIRIDETDRKIATILSQNSRTPFRKIAQQLNVSTKNVIQRYKRLRENLLTLSTITVDLNKLGYKAMANVFVKAANRSKTSEIHAQMLQIPNLIVAIRLLGAYDLYAAIVLTDFEELFNAQEQIRRIQHIEKTDIFLTPNVPEWPLNLFPSLLQSEFMGPKFAFKKPNRI